MAGFLYNQFQSEIDRVCPAPTLRTLCQPVPLAGLRQEFGTVDRVVPIRDNLPIAEALWLAYRHPLNPVWSERQVVVPVVAFDFALDIVHHFNRGYLLADTSRPVPSPAPY